MNVVYRAEGFDLDKWLESLTERQQYFLRKGLKKFKEANPRRRLLVELDFLKPIVDELEPNRPAVEPEKS